jgi:methylthioribulose-1-phosphate dehydratase
MQLRILERLVDCGREFYSRGWMLATAGNLSARVNDEPLRYAITTSGGHKGRLEAHNFVELSLGMQDPSSTAKTSAETVVHDLLYAKLGCGAILHVHGPYITLASRRWRDSGALDVSGFEYVKALGFWGKDAVVKLPIVPNHHDLQALATAVADAAGVVPVVLVESHGVYAWGDTIADAQRHIEATEFLCQMAWEEGRAGLRP